MLDVSAGTGLAAAAIQGRQASWSSYPSSKQHRLEHCYLKSGNGDS